MATSKAASILDLDRVLAVIERRCGDNNVSLEWDTCEFLSPSAPVPPPRTSKNTIHLPMPRLPITEADLQKLYGYVVHECGHHLRSDVFTCLENLKINGEDPKQAAFGAIFNIVEDDAMEREQALAFKGDAKTLGIGNTMGLESIIETIKQVKAAHPEKFTPESDVDFAPLVGSLLTQVSRSDWDHQSIIPCDELFQKTPEHIQALTTELIKEGWVQRLQQRRSVTESLALAQDLYKRLYPEHDDIPQMQVDAATANQPGQEPGEGDGEGSGKGEAQGAGEGDGDGEGKGEGFDPTKEAPVSWDKASQSEIKDLGEIHLDRKDKKKREEDQANWAQYTVINGSVEIMPDNKIKVYDYTKRSGNHSYYVKNSDDSRALANKVRRYLQAKDNVHFSREKLHGTLDKRSIVKLALPPIDKGEWNRKLFYQMEEHTHINTCIHILVDWSGSMSGSKKRNAVEAAYRAVHTFNNVLRMPVAVSAFTADYDEECIIGYMKKYEDRTCTAKDLSTRFSYFDAHTAGNNDADAVMWAYRRTKNRPENRKLLIVMSDGSPTDGASCRTSPRDSLKHVTKTIQDEGVVELYGLGIQDDNVKKYYNNYKIVNNTKDINPALFNLLKEGVS